MTDRGLDDRGTVLVEFALLAPVFLLLMVGGAQLGVAEIQDLQLTSTAAQAAACAASGKPACPNEAAVTAWLEGQVPNATWVVQMPSTAPCATAQISGSISSPALLLPSFQLSVSACAP